VTRKIISRQMKAVRNKVPSIQLNQQRRQRTIQKQTKVNQQKRQARKNQVQKLMLVTAMQQTQNPWNQGNTARDANMSLHI
jgi:hypothetical protein